MAMAKRSSGLSGWIAAGLIALGIFAGFNDSSDPSAEAAENQSVAVEVSAQD